MAGLLAVKHFREVDPGHVGSKNSYKLSFQRLLDFELKNMNK